MHFLCAFRTHLCMDICRYQRCIYFCMHFACAFCVHFDIRFVYIISVQHLRCQPRCAEYHKTTGKWVDDAMSVVLLHSANRGVQRMLCRLDVSCIISPGAKHRACGISQICQHLHAAECDSTTCHYIIMCHNPPAHFTEFCGMQRFLIRGPKYMFSLAKHCSRAVANQSCHRLDP